MKAYLVSCLVLIVASAIRLSCYPAAKRPESSTTTQTRITMRFEIAHGLCTYTRKHASLTQLQPPLKDPASFSSSENKQAKCCSFFLWKKCAEKIEHCSHFECTSSTAPSKTKSAEVKNAMKSSENVNGEHEGNPDEDGEYFQGDMDISETEISKLRSGKIDEKFRWKNNQVVYEIMDGFTEDEIGLINASIKSLADNTCIKFKVRTDEENYVAVHSARSGCHSKIGFQGSGAQYMTLGKTCLKNKVPAHEFIHVLGFHHEHSRTDRDDYITINFTNIRPCKAANFQKYENDTVSPFGVSYDYGSIMHYSRVAFLRSDIKGANETITPKQADAVIGQRDRLSEKDIHKINNMYDCGCDEDD